MTKLFGIDIAKELNSAIKAAGGLRDGTLVKKNPGTRTGGSLTGGTNPTETTHTFQGFVEKKAIRREGQVTEERKPVVTILGASVDPAGIPEINDVATIDGKDYTLLKLISRDPASAVYEFESED